MKGLLVTIMAIILNQVIMAEWSPVREPIRNIEYAFLQKLLRFSYNVTGRNSDEDTAGSDKLPIIIDISRYTDEKGCATTASSAGITSIKCLGDVVKEIADHSPKAIGIDIDLSPDDNGWPIEKEDWAMFAHWKQQSGYDEKCVAAPGSVPIKVGVFRRRYDDPIAWLGPGFHCLAAGLLIPKDHQENFYSYTPPHSTRNDPGRRLLMASALHEVTGGEPPSAKWWISVQRSTQDPFTKPGWKYSAYVVDYSYRDDILNGVYPWKGPGSMAALADRIAGNIVLIGDVKGQHDDIWTPHGNIPGVVIHACSIMTLRSNPLGFVDDSLSSVLDLLLAVATMVLVILGSELAGKRQLNPQRYHLIERRYRMLLSGALSLVCLFLAGWTHIFWPDLFWVAPVLILDTYCSNWFWEYGSHTAAWFKKGYEDGVE